MTLTLREETESSLAVVLLLLKISATWKQVCLGSVLTCHKSQSFSEISLGIPSMVKYHIRHPGVDS